jgi:hypothetical protein
VFKIQRKTIAGKSKIAGTFRRTAIEKMRPERKRYFGFSFEIAIKNESIIGPIIKISELTILPSRRGRFVKVAKRIVDVLTKSSFLENSVLLSLKNMKMLIKFETDKKAFKVGKFPANAASR